MRITHAKLPPTTLKKRGRDSKSGSLTLIQSDFSPNFALLSSLRQSRDFTDILWKSI
jgi:hypothetical protein